MTYPGADAEAGVPGDETAPVVGEQPTSAGTEGIAAGLVDTF